MALFVRPLLIGTVSLDFASVLLRSIMAGACPLGSRAEFLALVAFAIAVIYLILEVRIGERSTGIFALTPAFLLQVIATVGILQSGNPPAASMGVLESLHAFATIVGFSAVALCSVYGILYLALYGAIKSGNFGLYYKKMPPLEKLSDLNFVAVWIAFLALTVTIGLGLWGNIASSWQAVPLWHPEVILTALLWLLYGSCIAARRFLSLGGRRLAYTTLVGLLLLLGILLGGFFTEGFHG
jgi:ABC-type transport system involved in cytochrome c biogenesis permease subunit